jgi:hypothetical protein
MWPTQSTGSHLLLQKDTAASSDEACALTECSGQSSNRKRLYQIYRPIQGQRVLWKDLPSLLGEHDSRSTCVSLSLSLSFYFQYVSFVTFPLSYMLAAKWKALIRPPSDCDYSEAAPRQPRLEAHDRLKTGLPCGCHSSTALGHPADG